MNTSDFPYEEANVFDENGKFARKGYCALWVFGIRQKQIQWLIDALSVEEGWSVMILSHNFILPYQDQQESDFVRNGNYVWEILKAYRNGEKGSIQGGEGNFEINVEYDFTQNKSNDLLPMIFGHCHKDVVLTMDGITAISSTNLLTASNEVGGGWDYFIIDKKDRTLKVFRYGEPSGGRYIKF